MWICKRLRHSSQVDDTNVKDDRKTYEKKHGLFRPTVYHALVIIFLEFFSWGLLISIGVKVLEKTFFNNAFLMNGLIQGVKGLLSFLSAPLIGALSDVWGRKPFLFLTVTFTCCPIPFMKSSPMWYFALTSLSGVFAVTFSIIFAYVADITTTEERSSAYGLVSATFAASLVVSPYIGTVLERWYGEDFVVFIASSVAVLDVLFILSAVPETINYKTSADTVSDPAAFSWEKADPFGSLKKIGHDKLILMLSATVFLSYLPEAGEYSSFFVYLQLIMDFSPDMVAGYVAMVGIFSCLAQTLLLSCLMKRYDNRKTVIVGLVFETIQHFLFGLFSQHWVLFMAGAIAAIGSITYPAISVYVSARAKPDQQGVAQGVITGIRGLCNGLGPALFGFIFYLFKVDITSVPSTQIAAINNNHNSNETIGALVNNKISRLIVPGPPFVCGGFLVILAIVVALHMPVKDLLTEEVNKQKQDTDISENELDKIPMLEAVDDECEETDLSVDFS